MRHIRTESVFGIGHRVAAEEPERDIKLFRHHSPYLVEIDLLAVRLRGDGITIVEVIGFDMEYRTNDIVAVPIDIAPSLVVFSAL